MPEQPRSGGLDAETLAAYLDGQLPPESRAKVEAEIAADPEAYEWLVNALRTMDRMDASGGSSTGTPGKAGAEVLGRPAEPTAMAPADSAPGPVVLPFYRRRSTQVAFGAVLAAAAAVVLVVQLQPEWWRRIGGSDADPRFEKLVAAVGEERYIEGRLTGGFKYGPLRSVTRGPGDLSNQNLALLAAAGELQKAAQADPSAENLHAWGVALLLLGEYDDSIRQLQRAAQISRSPRIVSDLSAALIARADATGSREDLPTALQLATSALQEHQDSPELQFNEALALEALGLTDRARDAWSKYLVLDGRSSWAELAKERLRRLPNFSSGKAGPSMSAEPRAPDWLDAQSIREFAEEQVLPEWARATLALDAVAAQKSLYEARRLADAALRLGDTSVRLTVEALDRADDATRRRLAIAHEQWPGAKRLFETADPDRFEPAFGEILRATEATRSPMALWAQHYLAVAQYYRGDVDSGSAAAATLHREARGRGISSVAARAAWDVAAFAYQQARFGDALAGYREALSYYVTSGETNNSAAMHQSIAEALGRLGQMRESWRSHSLALSVLPRVTDPRRRQTILTGAAYTSLNGALDWAAVHFFSEALKGGEALQDPNYVYEAHAGIASAMMRAGVVESAAPHIERADDAEASVTNASFRRRFRAGVLLAKAGLSERRGDHESTILLAGEALDDMSSVLSEYRAAELRLLRGRARASQGRVAEARDEFALGIDHLESRRALLQDQRQRISYLDRAWDLYGEMIALNASVLGQPADALRWAERARARSLSELTGGHEAAGGDQIESLSPHSKILVLSSTPAGLCRWIISADGSTTFSRTPVSPEELGRAQSELMMALARPVASSRDSALLRQVAGIVLGSSGRELQEARRIVIVPDWSTQALPFAALFSASGSGVLPVIVIAPTVASAAHLTQDDWWATPQTLSVFTSPAETESTSSLPLPGARREAESLGSMYPKAHVYTENGVTIERLREALKTSDVVHLSLHAQADPAQADSAAIQLAGGFAPIRPEQFKSVSTSAPLVVLAACDTASGPRMRGETLLNLARPFLASGTRYVLLTLGAVPDGPTAGLMIEFHRAILQGADPPSALAAAQQVAAKGGGYWWAAFTIVAA